MQSITSSKYLRQDQTLSFGLRDEIKVFFCESPPKTPLFCPVCECVLSSDIDSEAYLRVACCRQCENDFAEIDLSKWNSGWRPSPESIALRKKERNSLLAARYVIDGELNK